MPTRLHSLVDWRRYTARTWTLLGVSTLLISALAAGAVLGSGRARPQPGVRYTTWTTERELEVAGDPDLRTKKFQVRRARRYVGPPPSDHELAALQTRGYGDALQPWLREPWRSRVAATVRGFEEALNTIGDACDAAIEAAKARIRGTPDEYVRKDPTVVEPGLQEFTERSHRDKDLCVSDSFEGHMRHYRIRRDTYPRVYELRQQDADITRLRRTALHEEIAGLLQREGRAILDDAAMQRAWNDLLARAAR